MTVEIWIVYALLAAAVLLFLLEWLSVDVVTLLLLVSLVLSGILTPAEAFSGLASEVVLILASIFILTGALVKTGVMEQLAHSLERLGGGRPIWTLGYIMLLSALISAFLSNTTATAILLPAVVGVARSSKTSPGQMLIPLAFASMLGGTCTLIGTSTNLAASGLIQWMGMEPYSLFEFLVVGLVMVVAGSVYLLTLGRWLLPRTKTTSLTEEYEIREYLTEVIVPPDSPLDDRPLREAGLLDLGLTVLGILRKQGRVYPRPSTRLRVGDILIVQASRKDLLRVVETPNLRIRSNQVDEEELRASGITIREAIVMPHSRLLDRTVRELNFRRRLGLTILAIYRQGRSYAQQLANETLRVGDILLLQEGPEADEISPEPQDLWLLGKVDHFFFQNRKGLYVLGSLAVAVFLAAAGWVPLSVAFVMAALAVILSRCVPAQQIYHHVEWRVLVLIGGMTSFGLAMEKTEAAGLLATQIVAWTLPYGPYFAMGAFVLLTMSLTQPLSNAAAAIVVLPVAVSTATQLQLEPRTFAVLVTLAASLSFIAPLEPACLLVYGPGKYRFRDFVKVGLPLSLIAFVLLMLLVPWLWPL